MARVKKVLLIDDDEIMHVMYRRLVAKSACADELQSALDGRAALDLLAQDRAADIALPDLIFLDVNMPRMGGFEFLEEYSARCFGADGNKTIVMLSTSLPKPDHDRVAGHPNVHSFIDKGIAADALLSTIVGFAITTGAETAICGHP